MLIMKNEKYYYYSVIGLKATSETFMKIVCVESTYSAFRNSNTYIGKVVDYIVEKYNVGITNINVLYSTDAKLRNMPNIDYIDYKNII